MPSNQKASLAQPKQAGLRRAGIPRRLKCKIRPKTPTVWLPQSFVSLLKDMNVWRLKKDIADQQKEVMAEAKGRGYDTRVMRKLIVLRKRDQNEIAEEEAILDLYKEVLGM